ncbi:MAG: hypothetical protein KF805_08710 [Phycisphaeraceae bacterium]|nr:hypothetical protein [Phycisphaeraceae bacterium]
MKPHPKIRKTVKWAGAVLTGILLLLAACSVPWVVRWRGQNGWWVGLIPFAFQFGHNSSPNAGPFGWDGYVIQSDWSPFLHFEFNTQDRYWGTSLTGVLSGKVASPSGTRYWYARVPIYALLIPILLSTGIAWRLDFIARRRARVGACAICGYDLSAASPNSNCPECGSSRTRTPPAN